MQIGCYNIEEKPYCVYYSPAYKIGDKNTIRLIEEYNPDIDTVLMESK